MKNVQEFQKLLKLTFPIEENSDYYIKTLMKSPFYAGLGKKVKEFEEFENFVEEQGLFESVKSYKLDFALPKLVEFLKSTVAYSLLNAENFGSSKFRTKDELRNNDNTYLVSIDFSSANFNALKSYDNLGEMPSSWEELCESLGIHKFLASSKSFRQYVFGNTNPGRLQTTQHRNVIKIVDRLIEDHGFEEKDFVFISHDEMIVRLSSDHKLAVNRVMLLTSAIGNIVSFEGINMPTHYKIFKNNGIGAGMCVQTQYEIKMGGLSEKYKTLFKVPGNKFFKYFKKYILEEPLDKRDLMFKVDNDVCVWDENEDSIIETVVPEGEISFDEAKKEYPYFIEEINKNIPGLSDSQIRKIVNITINLCSYCKNSDTKCNCWKDI